MRSELLEVLRCPETGQRFLLKDIEYREGEIFSGWLVTEDGSHRYPIRDFIPRFVPESNYADNFGMQWNKFRKTQLDSFSGHPISSSRFWKSTGWKPEELTGQWVLDVGCGAGRFAEIALQAGAKVVALDYSSAVSACYANLDHYPHLHVVQGDIYRLPLPRGFFSYVYSLGVLQTPDVAKAFSALPPMVAERGQLCVDFYEKFWKSIFLPKYWLRPITKRMSKVQLFSILENLVPKLFMLSRQLARVPIIGGGLRRMFPVANYVGILPLSDQQHLEWSLLDTFDWLSPEFDHPQSAATLRQWLKDAGMEQPEVFKEGHLVRRGWAAHAHRY